MTIGSFAFSLRLSCVTVMLTVAPDGIETPFEPLTDSVVVAVTLSSTLLVFVQIFSFDASAIVVPASMLPDVGFAAAAGVGAGFVGAGAALVTGGVVFLVPVVVFFVVPAGVGAADDVAVSFSCGFAALSRPASARFAASAESFFSESVFAESPLQAANARAARARDAAVK